MARRDPSDARRRLGHDNPRSREDNRPIGTRCTASCRQPTGAGMAHCSVCHSTFRSVTNFDRHRVDGWCVDPRDLGLVCRDGVWLTEMDEETLAGFLAAKGERQRVEARNRPAGTSGDPLV